jgi:hypothetical protein
MLKRFKTCSRFLWAGLLVTFLVGCGGTLSTAPGGISADKYSREASDRLPDALLGQQGASQESGSTK